MRKEFKTVIDTLSEHIIGKPHQLKLAVTCLLAKGHLLIEDLPGMGKTTLSHALAHVFALSYSRIQFTSDLLPADMLGVNIFDQQSHEFRFHPGPVFNELVLADEVNRASPKTQSALLEAMEEHQVSVDGTTYSLPSPFFVVATQNPSHQSGTYPLPESQLDRFLMRISLGYPSWEAEKAMLQQPQGRDKTPLSSCISVESLLEHQQAVADLRCSDAVLTYVLNLVNQSREESGYPQPLSPRASRALLGAAKAWAYIHDRDYVIPEDVQAVFAAVAEHRLRGHQQEQFEESTLSQRLLNSVDPLAA
ncbi:AAA family ATPase [Alteromonas confluentis]|uniref:AAA family ATPase n=1 Tax=Alteromonas confluentis TaxID=1656094 RepID=A0A1E7ZFV3_9ALTE|nr:MoxR family ATPase [Alteromonas confluentis]OFC72322.1 AAA family ATPase [Alteromonas confluentis]